MIIVPFKGHHFAELDLQEGQSYLQDWLSPEERATLEQEHSLTAIDEQSGRVIACAGVVEVWNGRWQAWSYLGRDLKRHMLPLHYAVKRFLHVHPARRIEATVDCDFEKGHKWVRMLGFKLEAERMVGYRPDGGDSALYAKVK